jgi:hypothetical protein
MKHEFWLGVGRLWVMTPLTSQAAALQKDGGANSRTIVYSKSLYVEDPALGAGRFL